MKKIVFLILSVLLFVGSAGAQTIALGQKVPELKVMAWLGGHKPQATAPMTYVEFFHSSNPACIKSMDKLKELSGKYKAKLRIVVLSQEKEEKIAPMLTKYITPDICVGFDPEGRIFTAFGVNYVPFGVLLDAKNRVLWMGNTLQITPEIIESSK